MVHSLSFCIHSEKHVSTLLYLYGFLFLTIRNENVENKASI